MGRPPCCDKSKVKKGPWTAEEDAKLLAHIARHGTGNWTSVPKKSGLKRCGKSCRLRWTNYLRPDLNHDRFTTQEEQLIVNLHAAIGSRWSLIAAQLPGRTDNDVKNHWNTRLRKKLCEMGIDPVTHKPISQILADYAGNIGLPAGNDGHMVRARISCLTKDLRTAYTINNNSDCPHHVPAQQPQDIHGPGHMNSTRPDGYRHVPDASQSCDAGNFWDLLTQLRVIKAVNAAESNGSDRPEDTNFQPPPSSGAAADDLGRGDGVGEDEIRTHDLVLANDNTTNPQLTWWEFLLEDEFQLPEIQEQLVDHVSWSNHVDRISASPADSNCSPLLSCHRQIRKPQVNVPVQQNREQNGIITGCISLQLQDQYPVETMKGSPSYSAGSCCSKNNIFESPSDVSSLDAVLFDSEYPLFWEFPDLENAA